MFSELECVGVSGFTIFSKITRRICAKFFFQDLENTCSIHTALKNTEPGLSTKRIALSNLINFFNLSN